MLGEIVYKIQNVEDTINNGGKAGNLIFALANELRGDESNLNPGDHLYVQRIGYTHHGIYIGNDNVIHYLLESIQMCSLDEFKQGSTLLKMSEDEIHGIFKKQLIIF